MAIIVASFFLGVSEAKAPLETHNFSDVSVYQTIEQEITPKDFLQKRLFQEKISFTYTIFIRLGWHESRWNEWERNSRSSAKGIYQILDGTWNAYNCYGSVFEAKENIECAIKIYQKEGFWPWCVDKNIKVWMWDVCQKYYLN